MPTRCRHGLVQQPQAQRALEVVRPYGDRGRRSCTFCTLCVIIACCACGVAGGDIDINVSRVIVDWMDVRCVDVGDVHCAATVALIAARGVVVANMNGVRIAGVRRFSHIADSAGRDTRTTIIARCSTSTTTGVWHSAHQAVAKLRKLIIVPPCRIQLVIDADAAAGHLFTPRVPPFCGDTGHDGDPLAQYPTRVTVTCGVDTSEGDRGDAPATEREMFMSTAINSRVGYGVPVWW